MSQIAKLYYRYGAMNAGKTETILNVIYNYEVEQNLNVLLIKPKLDTKGDNFIVGRSGKKRKVDYLISDESYVCSDLDDVMFDVYEKVKYVSSNPKSRISAVIVDEAQFLTYEDVFILSRIVNELDTPVLAYGLRVDSNSKPFEGSSALFALANIIEPITVRTLCSCNECEKIATRHLLFLNGRLQYNDSESPNIVIDADDKVKYIPVCSKCWHKQINKHKENRYNEKLDIIRNEYK